MAAESANPSISVIVPTRDRARSLKLLLESFDRLERGGVRAETRAAGSFLAAYRTEAERTTLLEEIQHIHAAGQDVEGPLSGKPAGPPGIMAVAANDAVAEQMPANAENRNPGAARCAQHRFFGHGRAAFGRSAAPFFLPRPHAAPPAPVALLGDQHQ